MTTETRTKPGLAWSLAMMAGVFLGGTTAEARGDEPAGAGRPNVLVILCDDLGYGDLGCFGHPTIKTPNLDKLATEGLKLTACYASAPVCSPSRAGLMTGRTPSRAGIYDWIPGGHPMHLGRGEITVATLLKGAGYDTCHAGKWHLNGKFNSADQPQPGDHGFDHWFSTQNNAAPSHEDPTNFVRDGRPVGPLEGYSCQIVADEAIGWLDGRAEKSKSKSTETEPGRPFFLFVCFHEPHENVAAPADLVAQYPDSSKKGEAIYYGAVSNVDRAVGRLMGALDRLGVAEETLVLFTSDNGPETLDRYPNAWRSHGSPGPLKGMKLHISEGGIRVPGIIRWPGHAAPGRVSDEPVCSLDLLPTLCALASVAVPDDRPIDGANILPLFGGLPIARKTPLFWHYFRAFGPGKVAIRDGDWKLVAHWSGPDLGPGGSVHPGDQEIIKSADLTDFELYNLRDDIAESRDLASREPARLEAMAAQIRKMYAAVRAEGPVWDLPPEPDPAAEAPAKKVSRKKATDD